MKPKLLLGLALVANLALTGCFGEPQYHGRSLSSWLKDLSNSPAGPGYAPAADAIRAMGTNALPYLVKEIKSHNQDAGLAVNALRELKGVGAPAIPELVELLQKEETAALAAHALVYIGGESYVIQALTNANGNICEAALVALHGNSASDEAALALLPFLKDGDARRRYLAVASLGQIQKQDDLVVPALLERVDDTDRQVRQSAVISLGNYPTHAKVIVPRLLRILADTNSDVRTTAIQSLDWIGPVRAVESDSATVTELIKISEAANDAQHISVGSALERFTNHDQRVLPTLIKLAGTGDKELHLRAISALRSVRAGKDENLNRAMLAELIRSLENPDTEIREGAAYALGHLGKYYMEAFPALVKLASSGDKRLHNVAVDSLRVINFEAFKKTGLNYIK